MITTAWNDLGIKDPYPLSYVELVQDWLVILSVSPHHLLLPLSHPGISSLKSFLYSFCPGRYILLSIRSWDGVNPLDGNYHLLSKGCKEQCLACTTMYHRIIGQTSRFHSQVPFILHFPAHSSQNTHFCSMPSFYSIRGGVIRGVLVCKIFNSLNSFAHNLLTNSVPLSE